jgi:hypothetical protein
MFASNALLLVKSSMLIVRSTNRVFATSNKGAQLLSCYYCKYQDVVVVGLDSQVMCYFLSIF